MDLPKAIRDLFYKKEENKPQAELSAPIVNETKAQPEKRDVEDPRAIYLGDFPLKEKKKAAQELVTENSVYSIGAAIFLKSDEERLQKTAKYGLGTWIQSPDDEASFGVYPDDELLHAVNDPFYVKYSLDKYVAALEKCKTHAPDNTIEPRDQGSIFLMGDEEREKNRKESEKNQEKLNQRYADFSEKMDSVEKIQKEVKQVAAAALVKLTQEEGLKSSDVLALDSQLRKIGLSLEELKKRNDNSLRDLLEGKRTPLLPIMPAIAGVCFKTEARLSARKDETGTPVLLVHPVKRLLSEVLEKPFEGHTFTNEQKRALMATGNAGEVISITKPDGKQEPVLVSVDRQVNDLVAVPVSKVEAQILSKFQDQPLTKEQKEMLLAGQAVQLNNIQSKDGNVFSGRLQYNAEKQKVELLPEGLNVTQIRNVVLHEKDQQLLREGKTILVPGLVDGKGEQYNAWVRLDMKSRQIAVQKDVPAQQLNTKKEITPGNDFKIQVNQNTKGLKTEENKHITEPLRHGQTKSDDNKKGMKL